MADLTTQLSKFLVDLFSGALGGTVTFSTNTVTRTALGTTSTDGFIALNSTAATAGTTVQISPRLRWRGTAWNSVGAASETNDFFAEVLPATIAGTTTATWKLGYSNSGGAAAYPMTVSSAGTVTVSGNFLASADNTQDIGAVGANRIRTGYFGTSLIVGSTTTSAFSYTSISVGQSNGTPFSIYHGGNGHGWLLNNDDWSPNTDNLSDLGNGTNRVRSLYLGTSIAQVGSVATTGFGVAPMVAIYETTGNTGAVTNAINYTPAAAASTYRLEGVVNVTAWTTPASFTVTTGYTDASGTARTDTAFLTRGSNGASAAAVTAIDRWYFVFPAIDINNAGVAITLSTAGTFTGSPVYNLQGTLSRVR